MVKLFSDEDVLILLSSQPQPRVLWARVPFTRAPRYRRAPELYYWCSIAQSKSTVKFLQFPPKHFCARIFKFRVWAQVLEIWLSGRLGFLRLEQTFHLFSSVMTLTFLTSSGQYLVMFYILDFYVASRLDSAKTFLSEMLPGCPGLPAPLSLRCLTRVCSWWRRVRSLTAVMSDLLIVTSFLFPNEEIACECCFQAFADIETWRTLTHWLERPLIFACFV